jgi:hypothetical protein
MTVTAQAPDLLTAWLSRIGRYGLLTHEEEVRLFRVIRRYGLGDRDPTTLAQLSRELGLSKVRVRELQRNTERSQSSKQLPDGTRRPWRQLTIASPVPITVYRVVKTP